MPPASLPFALPDTYEGLIETQGVAQLSEQALMLEFQLQDGLLGILKSEMKFAAIPYQAMATVRLHKGWTRTTILIQMHHPQTLRDVPKQKNGQLELRLARKTTAIAEEWVAFLKLKIAGAATSEQTHQLD
jgi:hypothetical protein